MLKYIGGGFILGIPARDLSKAEIKKYGGAEYLVGTGLYELGKKTKPGPSSNKALSPSKSENKE